MHAETERHALTPIDRETDAGGRVAVLDGPDADLAIVLLASGCSHAFIKKRAGFRTVAAVRVFARDDDVRQAVRERRKERTERVGDRALVRLEKLLNSPMKDAKAQIMAIRTALDVGNVIQRDTAPQTKQVSDLSVSELNELIAMTKRELDRRDSGNADQYPPRGILTAG